MDVGDPLGGFGAQGDSLSHEAEILNLLMPEEDVSDNEGKLAYGVPS